MLTILFLYYVNIYIMILSSIDFYPNHLMSLFTTDGFEFDLFRDIQNFSMFGKFFFFFSKLLHHMHTSNCKY